MQKKLTPALIDQYRSLDEPSRDLLREYNKHFPQTTVEWPSSERLRGIHEGHDRFHGFWDTVQDDLRDMYENRDLLRAHRSQETKAKIEDFYRRERLAFLELLFRPGAGFVNLRAIRRAQKDEKKKIKTQMVRIGDWSAVESFMRRYTASHDVYFGVASRMNPDAGGGLHNCGVVQALFVDIDFKVTPKAEARDRLESFRPAFDILIESGGGYHAYWLLDTACDLQKEADSFKRTLRPLARAVGGDIACAEPVHVLRPPATLNHKYNPPREVRLVQSCRLPN
jgi:hypothetical protein